MFSLFYKKKDIKFNTFSIESEQQQLELIFHQILM